jgi:HlyD family secretion protein
VKKLAVLVIVVVLAGVYVQYGGSAANDRPSVRQGPVSTGTVVQSVKALGTLQNLRTVQVGSLVSGTVKALYADFNSVVQKDQIIAELDSSLLEVQVAIQEANIARQENDIEQQKLQLANDLKNLDRTEVQADKGLVSRQQLETVRLQVKTRTAQIASAEKQKVQSQAQLNQARLNVSYCTIRSPIDGIVINRFVDVGQAVQASANTPRFFMIATAMTTLKMTAGVDEADIGRVRRHMLVTFTVDSSRGETFVGEVEAVRLNAQKQDSVVTYPVWINVPNSELKLRPSMTANVQIVVGSAPDVRRVPSEALKFRPKAETYKWLGLASPPVAQGGLRVPRPEITTDDPNARAADPDAADDVGVKIDDLFPEAPKLITPGQVWIYDEAAADPAARLRAVMVRTGLSDGEFTEIVSGDLQPGQQVVTAVIPPVSTLQQPAGSVFGQPQRGRGGMTPSGPAPLPVLNQPRGGGGRAGGGRGGG